MDPFFFPFPKLLRKGLCFLIDGLRQGDDTDLCKVAKDLSGTAVNSKVPAVVSAGIWPGVSWDVQTSPIGGGKSK